MYTRQRYEHLLELLVKHDYSFANFADPVSDNPNKRMVYLRHDIDYSVEMAVSFAEINQQWNAKATFFFQLRSGIYNFLSYETLERVRRIPQLGQQIGMHFAFPPEIPGDDPLKEMIQNDFSVMKKQIPEMQQVFGWHNPLTYPGYYTGLPEEKWELSPPNLCNVYSARFSKEIPYFSDSNLRYPVEEFEKVIKQGHPRLHLLFHPFQWLSGGKTMLEVLAKTWKTIIREREKAIVNAVYGKQFPQGMPEKYLEELAERIVG